MRNNRLAAYHERVIGRAKGRGLRIDVGSRRHVPQRRNVFSRRAERFSMPLPPISKFDDITRRDLCLRRTPSQADVEGITRH
ncbi:hypothetical protein AJ87_44800 [Rhizobium yanglingense]|nr:hypothetical protein AJ87_44800 [Rhizobium yanglingense]